MAKSKRKGSGKVDIDEMEEFRKLEETDEDSGSTDEESGKAAQKKKGPLWRHTNRKKFDNLRNLPRKQRMKGGELDFARGDICTRPGSQSMMMWDVAMPCLHTECPFYNRCAFIRRKKKPALMEKCQAQIEYVNIVYKALMDRFDVATITDEQIIKIGMQIIPLYTQLFKMKMIEYSLGYYDIAQEGKKGSLSIHPVYKEIRELIKTINSVWKSVGTENIKLGRKGSKDVEKDVQNFGDTAYYKMMIEGEVVEDGNPQWEPGENDEEEEVKPKIKDTRKRKRKYKKVAKKKGRYSKSSKKVESFVKPKNPRGLNGYAATVEKDVDEEEEDV
jgi:hypothetical protein